MYLVSFGHGMPNLLEVKTRRGSRARNLSDLAQKLCFSVLIFHVTDRVTKHLSIPLVFWWLRQLVLV